MFRKLYKFLHPQWQKVFLDYPVNPKPRYGHGKATHSQLTTCINKDKVVYSTFVGQLSQHLEAYKSVPKKATEMGELHWNNGYFPMFDIMVLYAMLAQHKPKRFIEVGSGNSTLVANKARTDFNFEMEIISIDPNPRQEITQLVDTQYKTAFEELEFQKISVDTGDILFIDNSHRVFPNSDSMVFFMEVLPALPSGVIVQLHDIYLPHDYPQFMCDRFYSEQYVLAAFLLSNQERYKTIFPAYHVSQDDQFKPQINKLFAQLPDCHKEQHGGSYWIEIQ
jgi:hypothetical protein